MFANLTSKLTELKLEVNRRTFQTAGSANPECEIQEDNGQVFLEVVINNTFKGGLRGGADFKC